MSIYTRIGCFRKGIRWKNDLCQLNSFLEDVIKTTIFLTDLKNFQIVNKVYSDFFGGKDSPARACVEVSSLPKGVMIEIDCVAFVD